MMATEIFNIDASRAEKLMKKRVSFLTAPTVESFIHYLIQLVKVGKNYVHTDSELPDEIKIQCKIQIIFTCRYSKATLQVTALLA